MFVAQLTYVRGSMDIGSRADEHRSILKLNFEGRLELFIHLIVYYAREGRAEGNADAVVFVAMQDFGEGGGVVGNLEDGVLAICAMMAEGMDDVGHKVAVESGALLLTGGIDVNGDLGDGEDGEPEGLVLGSIFLGDVFEESVDIFNDVVSLNRTQFRACGFGGH